MQKILIATTNKGKLAEIRAYLADLPVEFVSLKDVGITKEVHEDGTTYQENSQKKAKEYARLANLPAIADDGGLEIDALGGAPGIDSHYFAGKDGKDEDIVAKMIQVAKELPDDNRKALFRAVLSFALPDGRVWSVVGVVKGEINREPLMKILKGLPYRSFFYLPKLQKYYHEAELTEDENKEYNHRYKALRELAKIMRSELKL